MTGCRCPMPARRVKAQCIRQFAGDAPRAQVCFRNSCVERLSLSPDGKGLISAALGFGLLLYLGFDALGRVRYIPSSGGDVRRPQNIPKPAIGFLAMGQQPRLTIRKRQGVLTCSLFRLADWARRGAIATVPAPFEIVRKGTSIHHFAPQISTA